MRLKKRCSVGHYCSKCPNFSTRSKADLNFHIAKKHSFSQPNKILQVSILLSNFGGFYSLRLHKQKVHNAQSVLETKNVYVTRLVGENDDESLKEELETCKHFLVNSDMEKWRHRVFNFAIDILDAHTLSQKLDTVFEKLKCGECCIWLCAQEC